MIKLKNTLLLSTVVLFGTLSFGQVSSDSILPFSYNGLSGCFDSLIQTPTSKDYIVLRDALENLNKINHDSLILKKQALTRALSSIRYAWCVRQQNEYTIIVNIPSATLLLFKRDSIILESKVIVGKTSNRTPIIGSRIKEIVLYPYWFVPKSIATKELLPMIKKDVGAINKNGFQVLSEKGKIIDPYTIDWNSLSRQNFPYILRQSTGCDNSLGIIKLNFYNPFNVYLHDTPWKNLFNRTNRFYSHGCIRVEKAMELAHYLLKENSVAVDTLEEKDCLLNKKPLTVPLKQAVPIFVLYNTAWIDSAATVKFYPDIYRKFSSRR